MSLEIKIPNQYLCDLKKVECVPVIDETSVESKHLETFLI